MAYTQLTAEGKQFIRKVCVGNDNTLLRGKSSYTIKDTASRLYNPDGVLPFCNPATLPSKYWQSSAKHGTANIITNQQLGEALIEWFDKYGEIFEMDANIIAAQAYAESGYKLWNYPLTSSASGIGQFTLDTTYAVIISNKFSSKSEYRFTIDEIAAITKGCTGNTTDNNTFSVKLLIGRTNRPFVHQNICDNPEIMIKAQFNYMKYISSKCNGLASSTLFGYNRGPNLPVTPSYTQSISNAKNPERGKDYELEGIGYVYKIFNLLGKDTNPNGWFGYKHLDLTASYNSYDAEVAESNIT